MGVLCDFRKIIYVKKHFSSGYKNLFPIAIFFLLLMFTIWLTRTNLTLLWSRINQRQILILENGKMNKVLHNFK